MSPTHPKVCDKKMKAAELKLLKILSKIENINLGDSYISRLHLPDYGKKIDSKTSKFKFKYLYFSIAFLIFILSVWWIYPNYASEVSL